MNVGYAHLVKGMDADARRGVDEALIEIPLEQIADPQERAREHRRRESRRRGVDQASALRSMKGAV